MEYRGDIEVRYSRIYQLMDWKRHKEAIKETMELIQETPEDAAAYAVLANIYLSIEEYPKALHWSEEALRHDPVNNLAWYVRAITYYETKDWRRMTETVEGALSIDPEESLYYFLLANRKNEQGKHAKAKEYILKALELDPDHALYLAVLSYCEAILGNKEASVTIAGNALRQDVESNHVYLYLSWAAERRGDIPEQLMLLQNAIQLNPNNKQVREEYLNGLQKGYIIYRIILAPVHWLNQLKPWMVFCIWFFTWIFFKPLVIVFIIMYAIAHWSTKLLVHVKVFGWRFKS